MDIKKMRDLYSQIPPSDKQRQMDKVSPTNTDLVNKTVDHLAQQPQFTPKVK